MRQLPELDESCFVQMGDFVGAAFTSAIKRRMQHVYVGAMAEKLTKMGQGLSVTHAWKAEIDRDLLADAARKPEHRPIWSRKFVTRRRHALPLSGWPSSA